MSSPEAAGPAGPRAAPTYFPVAHHLSRALRDVRFPTTRAELLETSGSVVLPIAPETTTSVGDLLAIVSVDRFDTAAALYGALMAALRSPARDGRERRR